MKHKYEIPPFKFQDLLQALYPHLTFTPTASGSIYCQCPITNHSTPGPHGTFRIYTDNGTYGACVCPCGVKGTVWDFLSNYHGLPPWNSDDFDETILFVCRALGVTPKLLADATQSPQDRVKDLYRELVKELVPISFKRDNEHFRDGLYRGLDPFIWYSEGIGILKPTSLTELKKRFNDNVFAQAGLKAWSNIGHAWLTHGVVVPRRNQYGSVIGLAIRRYEELAGKMGEMKYVKNSSSNVLMNTSTYLYGYNKALRSSEPVLYVVEGEFDALALQLRGLTNTVTHGSGIPTEAQLTLMRDLGKEIVFVLDSDMNSAGFDNAANIAAKDPMLQFMFLPMLDKKMDPDTFMQEYDTEAFMDLDKYTGLQVLMIHEGIDEDKWIRNQEALTQKYMEYVLDNPSAYDQTNVNMIALLAGIDENYLKSWLFAERNQVIFKQLTDHKTPIELKL